MNAQALHAALAAVCPIAGVCVGDPSDRATWRIDFDPSATDPQRQAALAALTAWAEPAPVRVATGRQLRYALNASGWRAAWDRAVDGRASAGKPDDADYWITLGSGDSAPETSPKLARIAAAASPPVDLKALYDAALAQG